MTVLLTFLLLAPITADQPCVQSPEQGAIPSELFELFYAAKDSLDYGLKPKQPPASLAEFSRITPELLEAATKQWRVRYTRRGSSYEIVARSQTAEGLEYRATRRRIYRRAKSGKWLQIGAYCYF